MNVVPSGNYLQFRINKDTLRELLGLQDKIEVVYIKDELDMPFADDERDPSMFRILVRCATFRHIESHLPVPHGRLIMVPNDESMIFEQGEEEQKDGLGDFIFLDDEEDDEGDESDGDEASGATDESEEDSDDEEGDGGEPVEA